VLTENTESYGYDWLDRLTSTTGPWGTITYAYDQVGNRVEMVQGGTATNYTYSSFNRLTSGGSTTYTYDANGNMITKNDGTSWTFSYDYENRLTNVVHSGSTVQQNFYDAGGDRVKKTETDTVVFSYQGLNILYEKDLTTGTVTKHFYANGQQVAKMVGSGTYYVHGDHLGSTRLVLTGSLTVAFSSNYVPYGPNYGPSGSEVFMYTDKPYDSVTGLYYFGARFYDPNIGRFVTQDSYWGKQRDPQSLDRYIYAEDNPMKMVDPSGHMVMLNRPLPYDPPPGYPEPIYLWNSLTTTTTTTTEITTMTTMTRTTTTSVTSTTSTSSQSTQTRSAAAGAPTTIILTIATSTGGITASASCTGDAATCSRVSRLTHQQIYDAYELIAFGSILVGPALASGAEMLEIVEGGEIVLGGTAFGILAAALLGPVLIIPVAFVVVDYYACGEAWCG
jgi:RHS repeat-associated protein